MKERENNETKPHRAARVTFFSPVQTGVSRASGATVDRGCKCTRSMPRYLRTRAVFLSPLAALLPAFLSPFRDGERETVGVVNDIARMDAAECIASALRNLYRRLEARRATLTDLLLLLLGARITVHLFSVAARRTGAQLGHLRSRLTACGRPCSNADRAPMPCARCPGLTTWTQLFPYEFVACR